MFSIQYFILHPKILRFPFCRSFFGQRIGWRKAKRSPNGLYPRLRFVSLKEPDWQRAINNSLPNVNTIFNSCSIGNASNMLSLNSNSCCQLKNRRLSRGAFHSTKITGSNFRNFRWSNGTRQTASQDSLSRALQHRACWVTICCVWKWRTFWIFSRLWSRMSVK